MLGSDGGTSTGTAWYLREGGFSGGYQDAGLGGGISTEWHLSCKAGPAGCTFTYTRSETVFETDRGRATSTSEAASGKWTYDEGTETLTCTGTSVPRTQYNDNAANKGNEEPFERKWTKSQLVGSA